MPKCTDSGPGVIRKILSSMPGATREHESEQRERAWSPPGEPGQVGERPSAHPDGGGDGEHHADDQQRAEQQGQHGSAREDDDRDDQVPVVHRGVARVSSVAADCPPTSASAPGTACTGGAEPGDRVERRRGRSMRARTSSVTHGWVYVTQVGRQVRPPGSGRSPRFDPCRPAVLHRPERRCPAAVDRRVLVRVGRLRGRLGHRMTGPDRSVLPAGYDHLSGRTRPRSPLSCNDSRPSSAPWTPP